MSQKSVMIVDDSQFDRDLLMKALQKKGEFKIIQVSSADECLKKINSEKIDLILMDIMMPGTTGIQALARIREKFSTIDLPIIMVTAKDNSSDIVTALQMGANDYITKPVNFEVAVSRISTHLKITEMSHETARLREIAAVDAMITTYHHEINNALAIAIGVVNAPELDLPPRRQMLKDALWRVAEVVKKIKSVTEKKELEFENYSKNRKMVKVK